MTHPNISFLMITQSNNLFTIGKLFICEDDKQPRFLFYTMECPNLGNAPFISCIPAGDYLIKPCISPKFGRSYYFESAHTNVVGLDTGVRTHCIFHRANIASELKGCCTLGDSVSVWGNETAVMNSRAACIKFFDILDGYDYRLKIQRI